MKHTAYQIFKKPFFGKFVKPWRWPDHVDQSQWQRLSIQSQSAAVIAALLAPSYREKAKGAVLMCHPMGTIAKGFWMKYGHTDMLRQAGYHVMVFDFNGFGESTSTSMDYPLDVLAAGKALQAQYPDVPIAVFGASMGAAMSVCAMAQPDHPFKAAILESSFPTLLHFWSRYPIPKLAIQLSKIIYPAGERSLRPTYAAEHLIRSPAMLMIYGDADDLTPISDGNLLLKALEKRTKVEFWQVSGAKHTHAYAAQPEVYVKKVIDFLNENLAENTAAE